MADDIYNRPITVADKIERFVDKVEKSMNTLVVAFERKGIRTDV